MIALSATILLGLITVINGQTCPPGQAPFAPGGVPVACSATVPCPVPSTFCQTVPSNAAQFPNFVTLCCLNLPARCPNNQFPSRQPPTDTAIPCTIGAVNNCVAPATCVNNPENPPGIQTLCCQADNTATTLVPGATTTLVPGATTTLVPGATTTLVPGATTTLVPGATTTLAPATTTVAGSGLNPGPGGTLSAARCTNTAERPMFEPGLTYYRNCLYKVCPSTHHCEYDTTNKVYACCGPPASTSASDCAVSNVLMYPQTGTPVQCPTAGSTTQCPTSNRYCMYSASFGFNICCSTSTTVTTTTAPVSSTQACPASGIAMYPASANYPATPLVCTAPGSTTQCPASNRYCVYSAAHGYSICCSTLPGTTTGTVGSTDCSSTDVFMSGGAAVTCAVLGLGQCPASYPYCAYSTSRRQNVCCRQSIGK